jgi:hypothetical protein
LKYQSFLQICDKGVKLWHLNGKGVALTFSVLGPSQNLVAGKKRGLYPATKVGEFKVHNVINTGGDT